MELDAPAAPDGTTLSADVCIVGAGPAGLALADALQVTGLQVVLIESGGLGANADAQELNNGEIAGDPYGDLRLSRFRGIGGTANIWNTYVGLSPFAKYLPLDPIDFEPRDWMPSSGWPFARSTLDPYYQRAHAVCGLGPFDYRSPTGDDARYPLLDFSGSGLLNGVYHLGPAARFCDTLPANLRASTAVMLVHGATVTGMSKTTSEDRVSEVHWATIAGGRGSVRAATFVLAAGAIENARLLLLCPRRQTDDREPNGWLGRGFMEHPIERSLQLVSSAIALSAPELNVLQATDTPGHAIGRIALSEELLRNQKLPNASLRIIYGDEPGPTPVTRTLRPVAHRLVPSLLLRKWIGRTVRGVAAIPGRLRRRRYRVVIDLEQLPHPDNRVVLSDRCDVLGQPQAVLHWRWREQDQANRERIVATFAREFRRAAAGRLRAAANVPLDPNTHHHAGTTRMHTDPAQGVVDENLRVHGQENLFVTGASVFPTAGFANPTLTTIALTLRLADQLSKRQ